MAKFCMKCGRPLTEGQTCECMSSSVPKKDEPWRKSATGTATHISAEPVLAEQKLSFEVKTDNPVSMHTSSTLVKEAPSIEEDDYPQMDFVDRAINTIKKLFKKANTNKWLALWKKFKVKIGVEVPEADINVYEREMKIVPECISANEGEIPVRQYVVAKLRTPWKLAKAEGRLQVTNKRVIFRAPGRALMGKTVLQHEFELSEIAGIEARKEQNFSFISWLFAFGCATKVGETVLPFLKDMYEVSGILGDVLCFVALILGIIPSLILHKKFLFKAAIFGVPVAGIVGFRSMSKTFGTVAEHLYEPICLLLIICCLLYAVRTNLVLTVKTKGASGAVEIRRKKPFSLLGLFFNQASEKEDYTGFSRVLPMEDTEKAIREAGAVISDIQKFGDYGIDKWKKD